MRYRIIVGGVFSMLFTAMVQAQVFTKETWDQRNIVTVKVSQLYYELTVGVNFFPNRHFADFGYFAFGYGNPTVNNAWRKFIPENDIPEGLPKDLKTKLSKSGTDDLHAGKVAVGWILWLNHIVGFYAQAGWGFIADLSKGNGLTDEEKALLTDAKERNTFIYNTIPVELGLTLNLWKNYNLQAGVTYMWKEIPLLTVGIGYAF